MLPQVSALSWNIGAALDFGAFYFDFVDFADVARTSLNLRAALVLCLWRKPYRRFPTLLHLWQRLCALYRALSMRAKLKQLIAFYQIAARIETVYQVTMPRAVQQLSVWWLSRCVWARQGSERRSPAHPIS